MKQDPVELWIIGGVLGVIALMFALGIPYNRRVKARRAAALAAPSVRTPLYGSPFNLAAACWLALVIAGSFTAAASSPHGDWRAALGGAMALAGLIGTLASAFRRIGTLELDSLRLTFSFGAQERTFRLDQPLELEERFVIPSRRFPSGGAAFQLRQDAVTTLSFWVPYDMYGFKDRRLGTPPAPAPPLRTGDFGLVIAERIRASEASAQRG
jgi:hypothetical protein